MWTLKPCSRLHGTQSEFCIICLLPQPTSMTVGHGFVAAGGQNSQLDVRRLGGGEIVYKGHCGGSVNNALHIARDASRQASSPRSRPLPHTRPAGAGKGPVPWRTPSCVSPRTQHVAMPRLRQTSSEHSPLIESRPFDSLPPCAPAVPQLRLFVCNNDDTIKVYGLASGALVTMLRCPVAINYCALSPCGRCARARPPGGCARLHGCRFRAQLACRASRGGL